MTDFGRHGPRDSLLILGLTSEATGRGGGRGLFQRLGEPLLMEELEMQRVSMAQAYLLYQLL